MKTITKLFSIIVIALWSAASYAQASAPATEASPQPVLQTELAVAKAELEVTRKYQEHLLGTVYWSLGTLAAVAALLVGYSWWNNSRNYDRDRVTFEREAAARLTELVAKIADEQRVTLHTKTEALDQRLSQQAKEAEEKILSHVTARLDELKKDFATQLGHVKSSVGSLRHEVDKFHLNAQLQEHQKTRASGIYRNALQDSVTALEMAIKLGDEYEVGNVLDLVSEDVAVILSGKNLPIDNFLIGQLVEALGRIKGAHAHAAMALRAKAPQMLNK